MNTEGYPSKIVIAWGEAISGNVAIREWLLANGYPEVIRVAADEALCDDARTWLMENNFPHLMALINGAEGNPNALLWLKKNKYDVLEKMARAADNHEDSLMWLLQQDLRDMAGIAQRICIVKNEIERRNNDVHSISPF